MSLQKNMGKAVIHFIVLGVISGLTEGAGVLPDGLNAAVGGKVMFTTTLTPGTTFGSVTWIFGGRNVFSFSGSNYTGPEYEGRITFFMSTGSLELRNLALTDRGEYSVSILIPGAPPQTGITILDVYGLTEGAGLLPDGLNAAVGGKVIFTTTLTPGTPFQIVTWNFGAKNIFTWNAKNITAPEYEGRIIFFMSTGSLELRNLALNDSGEYSVNIIEPAESAKPGKTILDVYEPVSNVTITSSSTELVEFNSSVSLSCSSSGSSLSFLWLNSSSEVTGSDRVQITDGGSTLTIFNVTRYDKGTFRCQVSNPVNAVISDPLNLTIYYGPEKTHLTISQPQKYYENGSDISLMCSADSRPSAVFKWFLNGALLSDTGSELSLMNVQISQSGNYSCQAFNNKTLRYEMSQPSVVSVLEKVSGASVTSPSNLPIEGNSFRLICDAAGSVFTRKWRKGGLDLTPTVNMTLSNNNRELSFSSLNKDDTGDYSCNISNPLSSEEAKYSMIVNYGPETVQITGPSQIHVGGTFNLTCSAASIPTANYTWTLKWTEIHTSAVFYKNNAELSDSGNYYCEVWNDITGRNSSAVHELTVTHEPEPGPVQSGCSGGCIAGIVIGVLVVLVVVAAIVWYFLCYKNYDSFVLCVIGAVGGGYYVYNTK
ncbi:hypothetical protein JOQ06_025527 [Pogonophryne albipinna]|uniref:Ig-like domain-containing protein n=1 Tax=Pogonophryne albipinna TaxID=1090488 RepID=A0AAD6AUG9_9TELE|nr:hypothetical protein JOQ06_025527 [Pogonophryne albipinna]